LRASARTSDWTVADFDLLANIVANLVHGYAVAGDRFSQPPVLFRQLRDREAAAGAAEVPTAGDIFARMSAYMEAPAEV
jgi:hypothetical protein